MRAYMTGFVLIHLALIACLIMPTVFLWDAEHIGNPEWHPHARFHGVQLWFLMMTASIVAITMLWRSRRRFISLQAHAVAPLGMALAVPLAFWVGEFIAWPVPGTDVRPDLENPNTFPLLGFDVYGNAFGAVIVIALFISGYVLIAASARSSVRADSNQVVRV